MKNESYNSGPANHATEFTPYSIKDLGPSFVKQYVLSAWFLIPSKMKVGTTRTMEMGLVMNREFTSIFVVTYLPTILMNIINQAINYITHENKVKHIRYHVISLSYSLFFLAPTGAQGEGMLCIKMSRNVLFVEF